VLVVGLRGRGRGRQSVRARQNRRVSSDIGAGDARGDAARRGGRALRREKFGGLGEKAGKDWLKEDGPARWKLVEGGAVEVVPASDSLISHQKFGDCRVHLEFLTLGAPTNSGIYFQARYEVDINESFGRTDGSPCGNLGNCTPKGTLPKVRASRAPLEWQTLDVDFRAPRFDAAGKKTANARATVVLNGQKLYDEQELNLPTGAAGRLGEAPTGPIMLQEHGMPMQFRNVWVVEKK